MMMYNSQPEKDDIDYAVCMWITKIDGGDITNAELDKLKQWLMADKKHRAAFEAYAKDFLVIEDILSTVSEAISAIKKQDRKVTSVQAKMQPDIIPLRQNLWLGFTAGLAAACVVLIAGVTIGLPSEFSQTGESITHFAAHSGYPKTVELPDGSSVTMNTDSEIRIMFTQSERKIYLTKGEAVFDVKKDRARPFTVSSGKIIVKAIGTVFSVHTFSDQIEVLVKEGVVELIPPSVLGVDIPQYMPPPTPIVIEQGGYTRVSSSSEISQRIADLDYVERRLSWQDGILSFDQDSLIDVIREFNRYSENEIVIIDNDLAHLKVGGVFPIDRTDAFLDALEAGFNVKVEYTPSGRIEIAKVN